jgi:hypothetical protein
MQIESAQNPRYVTEDNLAIDLMVKFAEFADPLPFTAVPDDCEPWGRDLFNRAVAGEFGTVAPWVKPAP